MNPEIVPVSSPEEIAETARTAEIVWREHYTPLLGEAQVFYMVSNFQSADAISRQIAEDSYAYFRLLAGGKTAGYIGLQPADGYLFLSKLYICAEHRGHGLASKAFEFAKSFAEERGFSRIRLTVNKGNLGSIAVYQHWGFVTIESVVTDIGSGFVMDDYVMEYTVSGSHKKN